MTTYAWQKSITDMGGTSCGTWGIMSYMWMSFFREAGDFGWQWAGRDLYGGDKWSLWSMPGVHKM